MKTNHAYVKIKPPVPTALPFFNLATPEQISRQLQVTPQCVNSWSRSGLIPARVDEGRIVRFHLPDVLEALTRLGPRRHHGNLPMPRRENGFRWLTPKSRLAFDSDLPNRLFWQVLDECGPSAWVFAPAARLQTVNDVAKVIQTTRQTVNMWLRQGIIPAHVSSENVVRLDLEEVLAVLHQRTVGKRDVSTGEIRSPRELEKAPVRDFAAAKPLRQHNPAVKIA